MAARYWIDRYESAVHHGGTGAQLGTATTTGGGADDVGMRLPRNGQRVPGTTDAPLQPWLGRLFDTKQGFGRRFSPPALVRLDGVVRETGVFLPSADEVGLGCWTRVDDPTD